MKCCISPKTAWLFSFSRGAFFVTFIQNKNCFELDSHSIRSWENNLSSNSLFGRWSQQTAAEKKEVRQGRKVNQKSLHYHNNHHCGNCGLILVRFYWRQWGACLLAIPTVEWGCWDIYPPTSHTEGCFQVNRDPLLTCISLTQMQHNQEIHICHSKNLKCCMWL